jgi:S-adenosyl methyltransferase
LTVPQHTAAKVRGIVPTHHRPAWVPDDIDMERPSASRMYDYYLGGSHNFAADRELAEAAIAVWPEAQHMARANRGFLRRSVALLARSGVDQFLDLGSGIPTVGNVHEVASILNPDARTVYVDSDPVAFAHGSALLADVPHATFVHADLRDPAFVLSRPEITGFLDLARPVALLMFLVLPFVPDEDKPEAIVSAYRDATAPGSYVALSHGTTEYRPDDIRNLRQVYQNASHTMTPRPRARIEALLDGYELLEPGLIDVIHWRSDEQELALDPLGGDVARYSVLAAVGRRP